MRVIMQSLTVIPGALFNHSAEVSYNTLEKCKVAWISISHFCATFSESFSTFIQLVEFRVKDGSNWTNSRARFLTNSKLTFLLRLANQLAILASQSHSTLMSFVYICVFDGCVCCVGTCRDWILRIFRWMSNIIVVLIYHNSVIFLVESTSIDKLS